MFSLLKKTYFCTVTSGLQISMKVKIQEQEPFNEQHLETRAFNQLSYFIFIWLCWRSLQWGLYLCGAKEMAPHICWIKRSKKCRNVATSKGGQGEEQNQGIGHENGKTTIIEDISTLIFVQHCDQSSNPFYTLYLSTLSAM